ncbi:hypothetical protein HNV12_27675 [Methanococcoides sp. SA1]|nr:hypothetical protein [Methanococcoides sp. SA1]
MSGCIDTPSDIAKQDIEKQELEAKVNELEEMIKQQQIEENNKLEETKIADEILLEYFDTYDEKIIMDVKVYNYHVSAHNDILDQYDEAIRTNDKSKNLQFIDTNTKEEILKHDSEWLLDNEISLGNLEAFKDFVDRNQDDLIRQNIDIEALYQDMQEYKTLYKYANDNILIT